jgi:hypothetical protein
MWLRAVWYTRIYKGVSEEAASIVRIDHAAAVAAPAAVASATDDDYDNGVSEPLCNGGHFYQQHGVT